MRLRDKRAVVRLLLVDDHQCLALGLARLLDDEDDLNVVGIAGCLSDAEKELRLKNPDLVVLDIQLKGEESGFSFVTRAKALMPQVKVIVFSTFDSKVHRRWAEELGVEGYVAKGDDIGVLKAAIRQVMTCPEGIRTDGGTGCGEAGLWKGLSLNEERVISGLANGMSQKELAAAIGITPSTVATYVQRAKEKFGAKSLVQLIAAVGPFEASRSAEETDEWR